MHICARCLSEPEETDGDDEGSNDRDEDALLKLEFALVVLRLLHEI